MAAVIEIDGEMFETLEGFFAHFGARAGCAPWGMNLDAFNDVLRGGFGTPVSGFVLRWKNHILSAERLGHAETIRVLKRRLGTCHPTNVPSVEGELAAAMSGEGSTVFDWLIEIIRDHGPGGSESEDGVILDLA
jgi:RNAse (barnase) inhibitor barstar